MRSAISGALVIEKEVMKDGKTMKQQLPLYFVLEVLTGSNKYYLKVEKICYAVIMSSRKLCHYFEAHTIKVLANQPSNDIFDNRGNSNRVRRWAMELPTTKVCCRFEKRSVIKSQVLSDFIA
jgi:hypothetical protein